MSQKPVVSKHDSLLSLQNTIQDNTQYLQQLQDNNLGQVLKNVEQQLQENFVHLIQLEKNMEQLQVDMHKDLDVSDKIEKIYTAVSEKVENKQIEKPEIQVVDSNETLDNMVLQRVSNRVDTLARHFNHLNQSITTVVKTQEASDAKMNKILRKLDELLEK